MKRMITLLTLLLLPQIAKAEFKVGAVRIDITPTNFPVIVNGGFLTRSVDTVNTPLHARAIVISDGQKEIAIVVIDACILDRAVCDPAKRIASKATGIPVEHILMSATHTHSAPSCYGALGTDADPNYVPFLIPKLAEAVQQAHANQEPAKMAAGVTDAGDYTALRRWIRRPDKMLRDPFGDLTVRANMHPGPRSPDATGPSGPEDPDLSILSFRALDDRPIALLANFANHYVSDKAISADYFGLFAGFVEEALEPEADEPHPPFVAMMSQGTSGDIWLYDYFQEGPRKLPKIITYAREMADLALKAERGFSYRPAQSIDMATSEIPLNYRIPDPTRLGWARQKVSEMGDRPPKDKPEVYAREALILHERQSTNVILQAVRIGHVGLTAMPNEVYALTGLKLKAVSPLSPTINIELANGGEGYIPPPEQHVLGGYNTWPARSAGLEIEAEPKIVEEVTRLLEKVAGKSRKPQPRPMTPLWKNLQAAKPTASWRLDEWAGRQATDAQGTHHGLYGDGIVFYLEGAEPGSPCPHFAGGRVEITDLNLSDRYSVAMWFWNGIVTNARPVAGYLFSRGPDADAGVVGDHVGLGGTAENTKSGCLFFYNGNLESDLVLGETPLARWTWNHLVLVRDGKDVRIYLNGKLEGEGRATVTRSQPADPVYLGGRSDAFSNFEGRLDQAAVFDRVLTTNEIARLLE